MRTAATRRRVLGAIRPLLASRVARAAVGIPARSAHRVSRLTGRYKRIVERKRREEERRKAAVALAESEEKLRTLGDNLDQGFIFQLLVAPDETRRFTYLSAGVETLTGQARDAIYRDATVLYATIDPEDIPQAMTAEADALAHGTRAEVTLRYRANGGEVRWLHIRKTPRAHPSGGIMWDGVALDVTEQKAVADERERLMHQLLKIADCDPLTDLLNHRTFHNRLRAAEEHAAGRGEHVVIAILDLDNFKFFNDSYGHLAGDEVLIQVAAFLRDCCREEDAIARIGGDEFAVLMPDTDRAAAEAWLERLESRTGRLIFLPPGTGAKIPIRFATGIAVYPDDGATMTDVLCLADRRALVNKGRDACPEVVLLRQDLCDSLPGFAMLDALVTAVDNKDRYTRRHAEEVLAYAVAIADTLRLSAQEKDTLRVAALLQDVGKIGIPDRILRHPGQLTAAEFETMKQHPTLSGVLIGAAPSLAHIVDAVRFHHENWDGSGYPVGLAGETIPLMARILAVADAFAAMTTHRPYRLGMSKEQAAEVLRAGAGTQWDPGCVDALLRSLKIYNRA